MRTVSKLVKGAKVMVQVDGVRFLYEVVDVKPFTITDMKLLSVYNHVTKKTKEWVYRISLQMRC